VSGVVLVTDLLEVAQCRRVVAETHERAGRIDAVVNAAGLSVGI
jgi:NAD(P)-dependent dehydrogenase (short-subunit alcohol dehydrogenase family)